MDSRWKLVEVVYGDEAPGEAQAEMRLLGMGIPFTVPITQRGNVWEYHVETRTSSRC